MKFPPPSPYRYPYSSNILRFYMILTNYYRLTRRHHVMSLCHTSITMEIRLRLDNIYVSQLSLTLNT